MNGVVASDVEDGNLTSKVVVYENVFATNKSGKYNVTYNHGNIVEKSSELIPKK